MFNAVTKHINEVCLLLNSFVNLIFIRNFYDDERGEICTKYLKNCKCYTPSQCIARSQRRVMIVIECEGRKIFGQWRRRENEKEKEENIWRMNIFRQQTRCRPP